MLRFATITWIISCLASPNNLTACTSFCLQTESEVLVAKNLDWSIGYGYMFLNEKNVGKSILITELFSKNECSWVSTYRSLTFNQFGKEFPLGGMNECGLVVEELNAVPVEPDFKDSLKRINEFQLIQYLLDLCASTQEVEEHLSSLQYKPLLQHLHYLAADQSGRVLIIEFNGERFTFHDAGETGIPVLSNNNYLESLRYLSKFKGFGGELDILHRPGSNERFVSVARGLKDYTDENPLRYSFQLLESVKQADTRWSIVYDISRLTIHFKFHGCDRIKTFDFKKLLALPDFYSLGSNLNRCEQSVSQISSAMNEALLQDVFKALSKETGQKTDYDLLYKMALAGNRHLEYRRDDLLISDLLECSCTLPDSEILAYPDDFLNALEEWQEYELVGLGEATHGTREFCQLKHRLFRFLVENYGYRVLAYEYSFRKSLKINDYVRGGQGNIDALMQDDSWIQNNKEVKELIQWMRDYNRDKPDAQQLHFVGIDNQVDAFSPGAVTAYLQQHLPEFAAQQRSLLNQMASIKKTSYRDVEKDEYMFLKNLYENLEKELQRYCKTTTDIHQPYRQSSALRLARSLSQSHEFLYRLARGENIRDAQLAANALELSKSLPEHKLVVWAHNAHIASNPDYYGPQQPAMGWYLRKALDTAYLPIATSFSRGKFKAVMLDTLGNDTQPLSCEIASEPPDVSVNRIFTQTHTDFALNVASVPEGSRLYQYLDNKRPMIGIGDLYLGLPEKHFTNDRIINLTEAYKLVFYFTDTHPVTMN